MKKPEHTKWKLSLDILSLVFLIIFIGIGVYNPNAKAHDPNGDLTIYGKIFLVVIIPSLASGLWLGFRIVTNKYVDIISNWLPFRLLDKLYKLLIPIIFIMILLSQMIRKG